jgi:hypothetical protein
MTDTDECPDPSQANHAKSGRFAKNPANSRFFKSDRFAESHVAPGGETVLDGPTRNCRTTEGITGLDGHGQDEERKLQ